jgi:hypothetical protein
VYNQSSLKGVQPVKGEHVQPYSLGTGVTIPCLCIEAGLHRGGPEFAEDLKLEKTSDREGNNMSSEAALSDTSDPDQANDIEELLEPGYPLYFNYALPRRTHALQVRLIGNTTHSK